MSIFLGVNRLATNAVGGGGTGRTLTAATILAVLNAAVGNIDGDLLGNAPNDNTQLTAANILAVLNGASGSIDADLLGNVMSGGGALTASTILAVLNAASGNIDVDLLGNAPNDNTQLTAETILGILNASSGSIDADLLGNVASGAGIILQPTDSEVITLTEGDVVIGRLTGFDGNVYEIGSNPPTLSSVSNFANAAFILIGSIEIISDIATIRSGAALGATSVQTDTNTQLTASTILGVLNSASGDIDSDLLNNATDTNTQLTASTILGVLNSASGDIDSDLLNNASGGLATTDFLEQPTDSSSVSYTTGQLIFATNSAIAGNLYRTTGAGSVTSSSGLGGANFVLVRTAVSTSEDGTWTPSFGGFTGSAPTVNIANYSKVGKLVTLFGVFNFAALTTGNVSITGLPFTPISIASSGAMNGTDGEFPVDPIIGTPDLLTNGSLNFYSQDESDNTFSRLSYDDASTIEFGLTYETNA